MFNFDWPYLFLLAPLPLLVYYLLPSVKNTQSAIFAPFLINKFSNRRTENKHKPNLNLMSLLSIFAWLLLIGASAKPVWIDDAITLPLEGKNVILAIDLSGSMSTEDFVLNNRRINRLDAVKFAANEFIEKRQKDRIGLVVFGSKSYLYSPLTFDTKLIQQFLNESQIGMAGRDTAIGDGIALAIKHFREVSPNNEQEKILILLTDGANSAGVISPNEAIELAKLDKLRIYTIGLGSNKAGWFRRVAIDETMLKKIASETGGQYFLAQDTERLKQVYDDLDTLENTKDDAKSFRPKKDLFHYPLSLGLLCSLIIAGLKLR